MYASENGTSHLAVNSITEAARRLQQWIERRDYAGYEPFDILNSPFLRSSARHCPVNWALLQIGKRFGGIPLRRILRVSPSRNPKALGLMLAGYCDLSFCSEECSRQMHYLVEKLERLRSPDERFFCWGYDWDYISLRTTVLPAFRANAVASIFCGSALLDLALVTGDEKALQRALSVGNFIVRRLNRPVDTSTRVCFSYTPADNTRVCNVTALAGAFLARLGRLSGEQSFLGFARRAMQYVLEEQLLDGAWFYGTGKRQRWIDGFHTGYNLCALIEYYQLTGDPQVRRAIDRAQTFYESSLFTPQGIPQYYDKSLYPIDIHCCAQAILTFCALAHLNADVLARAIAVAEWTIHNMSAPDGSFFYRRHRLWTDKTPYMRWGQAWMFRALARLRREVQMQASESLESPRTREMSLSDEYMPQIS